MSVHHRELLRYEYKRFFTWKLWIWIGICFLINIAFFVCKYRESEQDWLYQEVVEQYRGISTKEKISDIYEKTNYYSEVLGNHAAVSEEYARGKISDEKFQQFISDYKYAQHSINGWLKVQENACRFEEQGEKTYFLYDVAWEKLFSRDAEWIFVFLMLSLFVPYFYLDQDSDIHTIGESYFRYRKVKRCRLYFAMAIVTILKVLWILSEWIVILSVSSLPDAGAAVCSIAVCREVRATISLVEFYWFRNLLILIKSVLDLFFLCFLSNKMKNKMQTTVILLIYLLVTNFWCIELLKWGLK